MNREEQIDFIKEHSQFAPIEAIEYYVDTIGIEVGDLPPSNKYLWGLYDSCVEEDSKSPAWTELISSPIIKKCKESLPATFPIEPKTDLSKDSIRKELDKLQESCYPGLSKKVLEFYIRYNGLRYDELPRQTDIMTFYTKNYTEGMSESLPATDPVNPPSHYTNHPSKVECIEITEHMGFCLGNAIKYIWRADLKGKDVEDLEKAEFYIKREIAKRKSNGK